MQYTSIVYKLYCIYTVLYIYTYTIVYCIYTVYSVYIKATGVNTDFLSAQLTAMLTCLCFIIVPLYTQFGDTVVVYKTLIIQPSTYCIP